MLVFNALQTSLNGGIGRYSYELAKELYKLDKENIKLVVREEDLKKFSFVKSKDLIVAKNIKNSIDRNIYEQFKLPKIINKKYPNAIIHYPDTMAPLLSKNKVIITVHDLAFKSVKDAFTWKSKLWKTIVTDLSIKKAKNIIAITNFTRDEILFHYPKINRNKISVIYNGFNNFSKEGITFDNISKRIKKIDSEYIMTVSTISPRKNIDGLIKAFNKIKNDISENLIIAGNNGWMYESVYKLVKELNIEDRVIFTGKINDDELKYLYKNSNAFVYISLYEGFGLPPLEAMSYGIPCIVSNSSSIPEVVGSCAIKVNPKDINNISFEIKRVLKEGSDISMQQIDGNLERFSWEKCANEVLSIIQCYGRI